MSLLKPETLHAALLCLPLGYLFVCNMALKLQHYDFFQLERRVISTVALNVVCYSVHQAHHSGCRNSTAKQAALCHATGSYLTIKRTENSQGTACHVLIATSNRGQHHGACKVQACTCGALSHHKAPQTNQTMACNIPTSAHRQMMDFTTAHDLDKAIRPHEPHQWALPTIFKTPVKDVISCRICYHVFETWEPRVERTRSRNRSCKLLYH